jgi:hypothetical protein
MNDGRPNPDGERITRRTFSSALAGFAVTSGGTNANAQSTNPASLPLTRPNTALDFINTTIENGSPVQWQIDDDGTVQVFVLYDYQRSSPNRAAGHWHIELQGKPGSDLTLVFNNFENVYDGRVASPVSDKSRCVASADGKHWESVATELLPGNRLRLRVHLNGPSLFLARVEPYRISDLDRLLNQIRANPLAQVESIGKTVEARTLEMVRIGHADAPYRVLLRARAHPWEPGGNWVVQGLIQSLLSGDEIARNCLERYCLYVLPMANKDGVALGRTRFNLLGKDLNRDWGQPADPKLAPENDALEQWLKRMAQQGKPPHFAMDLHNDEGGSLHVPRLPVPNVERYLARIRTFEQLLREHTWFTVGMALFNRRNGEIQEGLLERYGIDACLLELNCNWIEGLNRPASADGWQQLGRGLREVFLNYFAEVNPEAGK